MYEAKTIEQRNDSHAHELSKVIASLELMDALEANDLNAKIDIRLFKVKTMIERMLKEREETRSHYARNQYINK